MGDKVVNLNVNIIPYSSKLLRYKTFVIFVTSNRVTWGKDE